MELIRTFLRCNASPHSRFSQIWNKQVLLSNPATFCAIAAWPRRRAEAASSHVGPAEQLGSEKRGFSNSPVMAPEPGLPGSAPQPEGCPSLMPEPRRVSIPVPGPLDCSAQGYEIQHYRRLVRTDSCGLGNFTGFAGSESPIPETI